MKGNAMLRVILAIVLLLSVPTYQAAAQDQSRPRGRVPSNLSVTEQEFQRPKGRVPGTESTQGKSFEKISNPLGLEIVLKNGRVPERGTEIAGLVNTIDKFSPDFQFSQKFLARKDAFTNANELDRQFVAEKLKRQLQQVDTQGNYWIEGSIQLGPFDSDNKRFPIVSWNFDRRENRIFIKNIPDDQSKYQFLAMSDAEARFVLSEMPKNKVLNILIGAKVFGVTKHEENAGDLAVALYFETLQQIIWTPNKTDPRLSLIIASGKPSSSIINVQRSEISVMPDQLTVLDHEALPIFIFKTRPDLITDRIIVQMIMNRWIVERRSLSRKIATNQWPAFFAKNYPMPNVGEILRLIPAFRIWVENQAKNIGDRVVINVGRDVNAFDCAAFADASDPYLMSPFNASFFEGILSEDDRQKFARDVNNQRSKMRSDEYYKVGPLYFGIPAANLEYSSSSVEHYIQDFCAPYPGSNQNPWLHINKNFPPALKPANYPISIVKIQNWVTQDKAPRNYRVEARVISKTVIVDKNGRPKLFAEIDPVKYEAIIDQNDNVKNSMFLNVDAESIKSAIHLTDLPIGSDTANTSLVSSSTRRESDVNGVRLGTTVQEAESIISGKIDIHKKLAFRPKHGSPQFTVFTQGTIFISKNLDEYFILIHDPKISDNKVLAVGRFLYSGRGSIDVNDLIIRIQEKYSVNKHLDFEGSIYQRYSKSRLKNQDAEPCHLQVGNMGGRLDFIEGDVVVDTQTLLPIEIRSAVAGLDWIPWIGFQDKLLNNLSSMYKCDPTVAIWIPKNQGVTASFVTWVADNDTYSAQMDRLLRGQTGSPQKRTPPRL